MTRKIICGFFALTLALTLAQAQTPAPVVVQAVPAANAPVVAQRGAAESNETVDAALKALQALKAGNDEILKKQEATLLQLEELGKAAEQIKINSKRG